MKKLLHTIEKILGIYHWHPKIALRYLPIIDRIRMDYDDAASILEVGSGGLGIAPYLKRTVIGLDIDLSGPQISYLVGVKGSALAIPFADNSFDIVVSMDMLEHIVPDRRQTAIEELLRVGKKMVCIGVPTGPLSEKQDRELNDYYQRSHTKPFPFFEEHLRYGLPTREWLSVQIAQAAKKYGKKVHIEIQPNITIALRKFLMMGWMSENVLVNIVFRKIFLLCIPVFRYLNQEPSYRTIEYITIM